MTWLRKLKKQKSENRCIYTSEMIFIKQNYFPHPNKSDLKKLTGNSCTGIAYQLEINSYSEDDTCPKYEK